MNDLQFWPVVKTFEEIKMLDTQLTAKQRTLLGENDPAVLEDWLNEYKEVIDWYKDNMPNTERSLLAQMLFNGTEAIIELKRQVYR